MVDNTAGKPAPQDEAPTEPRQASLPTVLDLNVAKLTDVGRARPHNEDYVDYRIPPDSQELARKGSLFLVADGMGGHQAGEVASQRAVESIIASYYDDTSHDVPTSLVRAFRAANQQLHQQAQADPSKAGMGTTAVAAVILGRKVYVANVGDSRAYLISRQGITQITEDHSWVEEQVRAGLLTEEQARKHPQRNLVTRALASKPTVEVDVFEGEIVAGDTLLLCSDGLTGRVADARISTVVRQHAPEEAARLLVAEANERGGNDNITVLIVSAQEESATVRAPVLAAPAETVGRRLPLVPILAGLAILILVGVGGYLALNFLPITWPWEPTVSPVPSPLIATTVAPQPTNTATVAQTATETSSPAPQPTSTLASPSPDTTETPAPTQTLTPTGTPTATQAGTPRATNTNTPEPTPTSTGTSKFSLDPPTTLQPQENDKLNADVTFEWIYDRSELLAPSNGFQLLIWTEGNKENPVLNEFVAQQAGSRYSHRVDLTQTLTSQDIGKRFFWTVMVVESEGGEPLSARAKPLSFVYLGPAESASD